jgi:hypothetical protein
MGLNRRKMEDERQQAAEKAAAARRATDAQVLEDAERLIGAWNERQAKRMPILFSPTIGAAITARYWFLWVRCPACRTTQAVDLRTLDRHRDAAVTSPHYRAVVPLVPTKRAVRRARDAVKDEHRRRDVRRARAPSSRRLGHRPLGSGLRRLVNRAHFQNWRQLGDVGGDATGFVAGEQLSRRTPTGLASK